MSVAPTRRGLLSLFAAAPAALALPSAATAAEPTDWRTKPVEQWTHADDLAEASHYVDTLRIELADLATGPTTEEITLRSATVAAALGWWQRKLGKLQLEAWA